MSDHLANQINTDDALCTSVCSLHISFHHYVAMMLY